MKMLRALVVLVVIISVVALTGCGRYVEDAKDTLYDETKASTLLEKYERFKDLAASLDAMNANIDALGGKIERMEDSYADVPRNQWARTDAETYNQWLTERDDQKLVYNKGAAEYNAMMAKENYAFTNVGNLPQGAKEVLPREFREYIDE